MTQEILTFKYRPKFISDFYINDDLSEVLHTFLLIEKLNVILAGNSGSGKTSLIHALIREYYELPNYKDYKGNILFINTLKEQGISYYRNEVKLFCQTPSLIKNKKKILILDDLDLINEQGQQVFRNCIDKYNKTVFFIASCNNIHKIIDSIQSRMDIITIKPYSKEQLKRIAINIIKKEKITIEDNVIPFIVDSSNTSVRVLVNYLEKFKLLDKPITNVEANILCTNIAYSDFDKYTSFCKKRDIHNACLIMNVFENKGFSNCDILDNYFHYIKISKLIDESLKYEIIKYICKYITLFNFVHEEENELIYFTNNIILLFK